MSDPLTKKAKEPLSLKMLTDDQLAVIVVWEHTHDLDAVMDTLRVVLPKKPEQRQFPAKRVVAAAKQGNVLKFPIARGAK